jgi:hypothetical protein
LETEHFINLGFGWVCKHCSAEQSHAPETNGRARFMTEGEAEEKEPALSTTTLARWRNAARDTLFCPRCSIEEVIGKQ